MRRASSATHRVVEVSTCAHTFSTPTSRAQTAWNPLLHLWENSPMSIYGLQCAVWLIETHPEAEHMTTAPPLVLQTLHFTRRRPLGMRSIPTMGSSFGESPNDIWKPETRLDQNNNAHDTHYAHRPPNLWRVDDTKNVRAATVLQPSLGTPFHVAHSTGGDGRAITLPTHPSTPSVALQQPITVRMYRYFAAVVAASHGWGRTPFVSTYSACIKRNGALATVCQVSAATVHSRPHSSA